MRALPQGTVTFLFTDVEGSTRLLQELGGAYADVLAEHRRVLRDAFARHAGVEVDTQGDAFFVAFARASDALAAARDATNALDGPVRVRIGVHTGEPLVTEEGYVGIDVHRAARIAAAGHGGQILVSQSTRELVGANGLRDLGEHRLKDLTAPERIYQLGDGDFPPLRTLNATNLPVAATSLVGRSTELHALLDLVRSKTRVVTITGAGGSGKTRLGLQVAAELVGEFDDGVFFVPLAPLRDPELVASTIEQTLGLREIEELAGRDTLLLLDNFEHLIAAAPDVAALLAKTARLKLLITSRAPLRIEGEREFALEPFADAEAVEFFRERAQAVRADVALNGPVAEICRRLDCLPLALELAAARIKVFDPPALLARLDRRLPLLTGGRRDVPERQRTLRSTIEWSYDLLAERGKQLFSRLAVFAGSFSLGAAEEVCGTELEQLASLVDVSLLKALGDGRFLMLETIREYAIEQLKAWDPDETRRCHAAYFLALANDVDARIRGPEQYELVDMLELEHDNMRAALEWYVTRDANAALQFVLALEHFWVIRNHLQEADRWFAAALAAPGRADVARSAHAARQAGHLAWGLRDLDRARRLHEKSLSLAIAAKSKVDIAHALVVLGREEEGLRLFDELGDDRRTASAMHYLGGRLLEEGDLARAHELLQRTVELYRLGAIPADLASALNTLADCELVAGDLGAAALHYRESLEIFSRLGSRDGVAYCLGGIASLAATRGDRAVAARLWRAAEDAEEELGRRLWESKRRRYEHALAAARVGPIAEPMPEAVAVREAFTYVD